MLSAAGVEDPSHVAAYTYQTYHMRRRDSRREEDKPKIPGGLIDTPSILNYKSFDFLTPIVLF